MSFIEKFSEYVPLFEADQLNDILPYTPWAGHRIFAYDLIQLIKPELLVELGTHYGCSFFSFAQAVKDAKLNSRLVAVDTWAGDHQTGYYSEEVYQTVIRTCNTYYPSVNLELLRCYFHEALDRIEDQSIDILHIDGCHDYENVRQDFESWFPKMKKNGIVLFHDIAERTGYGSSKFWNEMKNQFSHYIEFQNDWGLGVLFLDQSVYRLVIQNLDLAKYELICSQLADKYKLLIIDQIYKIKSLNQHIQNQKNHINHLIEENRKLADQLMQEKLTSLLHKLIKQDIRNVVVYGTGGFAKKMSEFFVDNGISIELYVDSNRELWGTRLGSVEIVSLQEAMTRGHRNFVIGSYSYIGEIAQIIEKERQNQDMNVFSV